VAGSSELKGAAEKRVIIKTTAIINSHTVFKKLKSINLNCTTKIITF